MTGMHLIGTDLAAAARRYHDAAPVGERLRKLGDAWQGYVDAGDDVMAVAVAELVNDLINGFDDVEMLKAIIRATACRERAEAAIVGAYTCPRCDSRSGQEPTHG